ncbi:unnamed protein product [Protopolystoma xenopodis]|uniref:Uncharacterized protein n=1 Tax=Protopolystoma xenopodis TaxID=117903 RepID=A0A3S5C2I5_9PLAT|nr:unnamed protein product [Protopolystoma xenopodis]
MPILSFIHIPLSILYFSVSSISSKKSKHSPFGRPTSTKLWPPPIDTTDRFFEYLIQSPQSQILCASESAAPIPKRSTSLPDQRDAKSDRTYKLPLTEVANEPGFNVLTAPAPILWRWLRAFDKYLLEPIRSDS